MRFLILLGALVLPFAAFTQDTPELTQDAGFNQGIKKAYEDFQAGKYAATRKDLDELAEQLRARGESDKTLWGLLAYWRGVTANRQVEYPDAIASFEEALRLDYRPKDIYYEYGQALYAAEKLPEARRAFRESLKRGHKRAVCLYYIGFISQGLGDFKSAATFYRAIERLPVDERDDTLQAAYMQVGDIFLEQAEKRPDALKAVEVYVIPQYEEALAVDPESRLAQQIRARIRELQQKYELVLFRMRNGRPTPVPPYFLRIAQDVTFDSNPVFAATETTNTESKQSSLVSKTEAFGRYSFFYKNIMSFAPELRTSYTRHLKREEEIYRNDNWLLAPALRTSYEHHLGKKQASTIADLDYAYSHRDRDAEEDLKFNSRITTLTLGERVEGLFGEGSGQTTLRLRHRLFDSYDPTADSRTNGLGLEHVYAAQSGKLWIFNVNYDQTRVEDDSFDTNTLFLRADVIFAPWAWGITPQAGFGLTLTDPINNSARGQEKTWNPSVRLGKYLGKRWRLSLHADYMENISDDEENFAYTKSFYGLELEYLF